MTALAVMAAVGVVAVVGIVVIVHRLQVLDAPAARADAESIRNYHAALDALASSRDRVDDSDDAA